VKRREKLLACAGLATAVLTVHAYLGTAGDAGVVEAAARQGMARHGAPADTGDSVSPIQPVALGVNPGPSAPVASAPVGDAWPDLARDPFGPPPAPPAPPPPPVVAAPPPPPPPKPTAPPLPYRYFGRMADVNGQAISYLSRGEELLPVRENDVLDQVYRVEKVDASQIVLVYLPLDERTTISVPPAANH
jgi:hypothetical protein